MKWTKERPSKSGYYWLRYGPEPHQREIVEIHCDRHGMTWCSSMFGQANVGKMDIDKNLWSDEPIQEPQE